MEIRVVGLTGIPEVKVGDDLGRLIVEAAERQGVAIASGDVVVVTSKVVSKVEGRLVPLSSIKPSRFARQAAEHLGKDPRVLEAVLQESRRVVRMVEGLVIAETRHGHICANAGVDQSNVPNGWVALLPLDPDGSARRIRERIRELRGVDVAVIVSDTQGRPWREGQIDVAIGVSGLLPIKSYKGVRDPHGYELRVTAMAIADELASAAELVMGKVQNIPAAIIKGFSYPRGEGSAQMLLRPPDRDIFR